jgi:5-formyltetrahydrofolate cyclo-ligase
MEDKKTIREKVLKTRNAMIQKEVSEKSREILKNLMTIPEFSESNCISIYLSFSNEVDTFLIIEALQKLGKKIVVPYTKKDIIDLLPVQISSVEKDLTVSSFGYPEPILEKVSVIDIQEIDFIIIPGVAFDGMGNRVGFGKGYYDKYLSKIKRNIKKTAVAYEYQVLRNVPSESHDIKMDYIVTEKRVIKI